MRLWSLHPKYLDPQGLVALWREALLAQAVLRGRTRGYRHHPQLARFAAHPTPRRAINAYLHAVHDEALARGYDFDKRKAGPRHEVAPVSLTHGQLQYEWRHLLGKLSRRDRPRYLASRGINRPRAHPLFRLRAGGVATWERAGSG